MKLKFIGVSFFIALCPVMFLHAEDLPDQAVSVNYFADIDNLADFTVFANAGWDGSWFVGYTKTWIQKIYIPEQAHRIAKAFIGAKLGRMKVRPVEGKPAWESEAIPGRLFMAVSSTPTWTKSQRFFLTKTRDIPFEGDPEVAMHHVGESRWFWIEVPLDMITMGGENYCALWSPSKKLADEETAPIVAAGWDVKDKRINTWIFPDAKGELPEGITAACKSISYFEPAIAIKLVPHNDFTVSIYLKHHVDIVPDDGKLIFSARVTGVNIEKVGLQIEHSGNTWTRHGMLLYTPPFYFTLDPSDLPRNIFKLRAIAWDEYGNVGLSNTVELKNN